jgi:hypothetical protein
VELAGDQECGERDAYGHEECQRDIDPQESHPQPTTLGHHEHQSDKCPSQQVAAVSLDMGTQ